MSKIDELLKLKELLDSGLINQNDFDKLKKKIFEEQKEESTEYNKIKNSELSENITSEINSFKKPNIDSNNTKYKIIGLFVFVIIFVAIIYYNVNQKSSKNIEEIKEIIDSTVLVIKEAPALEGQENYVDTLYTNNDSVSNDYNSYDENQNSNNGEDNINNQEVYEIEVDVPFAIIDEAPIFPGCENIPKEKTKDCFQEKLQAHIRKNFTYPEAALDAGDQGKVFIDFIIEKDGTVTITNTKAPYSTLETEAKRIIYKLPKMYPAKQNGKPVRMTMSVPITFKLE